MDYFQFEGNKEVEYIRERKKKKLKKIEFWAEKGLKESLKNRFKETCIINFAQEKSG